MRDLSPCKTFIRSPCVRVYKWWCSSWSMMHAWCEQLCANVIHDVRCMYDLSRCVRIYKSECSSSRGMMCARSESMCKNQNVNHDEWMHVTMRVCVNVNVYAYYMSISFIMFVICAWVCNYTFMLAEKLVFNSTCVMFACERYRCMCACMRVHVFMLIEKARSL
jgi:hypothetical protein